MSSGPLICGKAISVRVRTRTFRGASWLGGVLFGMGLALILSSCGNALLTKLKDTRSQAESPTIVLAIDGGVGIPNGGSYDFGEVSISQTSNVVLVVRNIGKTELKIPAGTVSIGGTDAACFTWVTSSPASLVPQAEAKVAICFKPESIHAKNATVTFVTNDVANPVYSFSLKGVGIDKVSVPIVVGGVTQCYPDLADQFATFEISCDYPNAKIYYTTDNSLPSMESLNVTTNLYSGSFQYPLPPLATDIGIIKIMAMADGVINSDVVVVKILRTKVEDPVITAVTPGPVFYPEDGSLHFTITSATSNALIYFTIDGSNPSYSGATKATDYTVSTEGLTYFFPTLGSNTFEYRGPHTNHQLQIKALGKVNSSISATVGSASYTFQMSQPFFNTVQPVAAPATFFATAPAITLAAKSTAASTLPDFAIRYTFDGTTIPTASVGTSYAVAYNPPVGVAGASAITTVKAVAWAPNWLDSTVLGGVFSVCGPGVWSSGSDNSKWDQAVWQ